MSRQRQERLSKQPNGQPDPDISNCSKHMCERLICAISSRLSLTQCVLQECSNAGIAFNLTHDPWQCTKSHSTDNDNNICESCQSKAGHLAGSERRSSREEVRAIRSEHTPPFLCPDSFQHVRWWTSDCEHIFVQMCSDPGRTTALIPKLQHFRFSQHMLSGGWDKLCKRCCSHAVGGHTVALHLQNGTQNGATGLKTD